MNRTLKRYCHTGSIMVLTSGQPFTYNLKTIDMFQLNLKTLKNRWLVTKYTNINNGNSGHVETVVLINGGLKMQDFTVEELSEAHRALLSTLHKCEKMDAAKLGKSQQTLLERRIAALKVALTLIEKEQNGGRIGKGQANG